MPSYDFQAAAVEQTLDALEHHRSVLLQAPTGAGKTRMAIEVARHSPGPVLFLAERREIIRQTAAAFSAAGCRAATLDASSDTRRWLKYDANFVVAAQRTAWSRVVRRRHDLGEFQTIIVDEAHHARARTYEELLKRWPDARRLLLTATPVRADGRGLGNVAAKMVQGDDYGGNYRALIDAGVLVPAPPQKIWSWPVNLAGIRTQAGDYAMGGARGAAVRLDTPTLLGDIVQHWRALAENRPTIAYCSSVGHAEHLAEAFGEAGVGAAVVHAGTEPEERDRILARLSHEESLQRIVCNFGVLVEGFDCPPVSCLILARPTKQLGTYLQMVGRGLRASPGKTDLMILDHAGIVPMHGVPGEDIHWRLTTTDDAAERKPPKVKPCPQCSAILLHDGTCGACGWKPERRIEIEPNGHLHDYDDSGEDRAVNLIRLSDALAAKVDADMASPQRTEYRRLARYGEYRGFKPQWAAYRFKEKYGDWPKANWDLPDPRKCEPSEYLEAAQAFAETRGWKPEWAAHRFKETYGRFPPQ